MISRRGELEDKKKELLKAQLMDKKILSPENAWIQAFRQHEHTKVLTRDVLLELIDHITVSGYNTVEIFWNFRDDVTILEEFTKGGGVR